MDNLHVRLNIDLGKDHPSSEEHLKYGKIAKFSWKCYKRRNLFIYLFIYLHIHLASQLGQGHTITVGSNYLTHPVYFPLGGNRSARRKLTTFGRA